MEQAQDRGAGAFQTRASDEEVCFALRGVQVLVRPQDVELGGVHAAVCAKGGGRHQEPNPLFRVLPEAADGEGHDRKNRSGQSEIAQTGVQAGMSYYVNNTMSIGPFFSRPQSRGRFAIVLAGVVLVYCKQI